MPGKSRDLNYRLTADPSDLDRGFDKAERRMKSAEKSAAAFERELAKLEAQQHKVDMAMAEVGQSLFIAGAAIGAGLAVATKAAIDWESAWAGVTKTVDGSPQQMAALEAELRDLAGTLPLTHKEIAAVAEAAGQLGIKRKDIIEFTRTMVDLGVTTNLTATDAATALARMSNIMGTATKDIRRLGSTLVDLGNNSATTEQEILDMALRIAGAGKTIGLSEAQVLSFAAALSSVGIMAEAGGSAISRVFIHIESAVRGGGEQLARFAKVAGISSTQFVAAYQRDAATAIDMFITGLGRMQKSGQNVFETMADLGMSEIILRDAVLRMAGASDVLTKSLQTGNRAWDENIALTEEANKRYATTEARLQIARNKVNDFAISLGQGLLPVAATIADTLGFVADTLGALPGPVKQALGVLGLLAAMMALTGGAALMAVPRIAAYRAALETLELSGKRSGAALAGAARFMTGPWGIAIAGAVTALLLFVGAQAKSNAKVDEFKDTLDEATGALTENTRALAAHELKERGAFDAARKLGLSLSLITDAALGNADAIAKVNAAIDAATSGESKYQRFQSENAESARALRAALHGVSGEVTDSREVWQQQTAAIHGNADATKRLPPEQRRLAEALGLTAEQAQTAAVEIDKLDKELKALFDQTFSLEEAEDALAEAFENLREQVKRARQEGDKNATSLTGQSEAARANRDAARELVRKSMELLETQAKLNPSTEALTALTKQLREQLVQQLVDMGFAREEAERYAGALDGIPSLIPTSFTTPGLPQAQSGVTALQRKLEEIDRRDYGVDVNVHDRATPAIVKILNMLAKLPKSKRIAMEFGFADGGRVGFAGGGRVEGPGGPREDNLLIRASSGEFVVNAAATARNLPLLEAINAGMPATAVTSTAAAAATPPALSLAGIEAAVERGAARGIAGAQVILDSHAVGVVQATTADRYSRGG